MKLNTKQRIAIFGTSADPPTIAHKKILEELSKIYSLTITYASNNPQKEHKEDISIRSILLKTLIKISTIKNTQLNISLGGSSGTLNILHRCSLDLNKELSKELIHFTLPDWVLAESIGQFQSHTVDARITAPPCLQ